MVKVGHEINGKIREGKIVLIKYMELQSRRFSLVNYRCDTYIRHRVNSYLITFSLNIIYSYNMNEIGQQANPPPYKGHDRSIKRIYKVQDIGFRKYMHVCMSDNIS